MARITSFTAHAPYTSSAEASTPNAGPQAPRSRSLSKKFFRLFKGPRAWFSSNPYRRYSEPQIPESAPAQTALLSSELNKQLDRQKLQTVVRQQPNAVIAKMQSADHATALEGLREFAEGAHDALLKVLPSRYVADALNEYTDEQAVADVAAQTADARPDAGKRIIFQALKDFIVDHFADTRHGPRDSEATVVSGLHRLV